MKPFSEVQDEISVKLQKTSPVSALELIEKLYSEAVIETDYDYVDNHKGA